MKSSAARILVAIGLAVFVVSIAIVRLTTLEDEEASLTWEIAATVLMLGLTVGPALLAEPYKKKYQQSRWLHKKKRLLEAELRRKGKRFQKSRKLVERLGAKAAKWERDAEVLRAKLRIAQRKLAHQDARSVKDDKTGSTRETLSDGLEDFPVTVG